MYGHAPLDATPQRARLIHRQIVLAARAQQIEDGFQRSGRGVLGAVRGRGCVRLRAYDVQNAFRQIVGEPNHIGRSGRDGALRHGIKLCRTWLLRKGQAALRLDRLQTERSVRPHAG